MKNNNKRNKLINYYYCCCLLGFIFVDLWLLNKKQETGNKCVEKQGRKGIKAPVTSCVTSFQIDTKQSDGNLQQILRLRYA